MNELNVGGEHLQTDARLLSVSLKAGLFERSLLAAVILKLSKKKHVTITLILLLRPTNELQRYDVVPKQNHPHSYTPKSSG